MFKSAFWQRLFGSLYWGGLGLQQQPNPSSATFYGSIADSDFDGSIADDTFTANVDSGTFGGSL